MYKLISHRGSYNKNIKENSFSAIINAFKNDKYVGVEFDVRVTQDNEFILYHNAIYNNKLIKNTTYKELPKYVPKLEKILKIHSNKIFLIEIKNVNNQYEKLFKLLNKYKDKNIYVMSFSKNIIKKLNKKERTFKLGLLNYVFNTDDSLENLDFVGILNSLINDLTIKKLSKLEIFSYGIFEQKKYEDIYYITDN